MAQEIQTNIITNIIHYNALTSATCKSSATNIIHYNALTSATNLSSATCGLEVYLDVWLTEDQGFE